MNQNSECPPETCGVCQKPHVKPEEHFECWAKGLKDSSKHKPVDINLEEIHRLHPKYEKHPRKDGWEWCPNCGLAWSL